MMSSGQDNIGWIIGLGGLVLVFGFYLWAWVRVGRDPALDTVVPRWIPPEGVSPALANYIEKRGFRGEGWTAFAASLLDLAVKGHVDILDPKRALTIRRKGSGMPKGIGVGQRSILRELSKEGDTLTADKAGGQKIQALGQKFQKRIEAEHRNKFYRENSIYLTIGVILSIVTLVLILAFEGFHSEIIRPMIGLLVVSALIAILIPVIVLRLRKLRTRKLRSVAARVITIIACGFLGLVLIVLLFGLTRDLMDIELGLRLVAVSAAIVVTNVVFFFIMGAPTPIGQKRSAEIAGLKQYLTLAEKDRMNMRGAPEMSPQHFETLLPYAVALDVEKPWSKTFDAWLATAAAAYTGPAWYDSTAFDVADVVGSIGDLTHAIADSLPASLPEAQGPWCWFSGEGGFFDFDVDFDV